MKRIILLIALALTFLAGTAQDEDAEFKTIFNKGAGHISHGGYGAIIFGYTQMNDKDVYMFGIKGIRLKMSALYITILGTLTLM